MFNSSGSSGNCWSTSEVRTFMKDTLINDLFKNGEDNHIKDTSLKTTWYDGTIVRTDATADTSTDKLFLLSMTQSSYTTDTFNVQSYLTNNTSRRAKASDLGYATGCAKSTNSGYEGDTYWRLRAGYYTDSAYACDVIDVGLVGRDGVIYAYYGLRAAFVFDMNPIEGYTKLEYIQGYGGQYIDTGVTIDSSVSTLEVDMQIKYTDLSTRQLMGYSGSAGGYFGVNNGVYTLQYGVSLGLAPSLTSYDHLVYKKETSKDSLTVNGTTAQSGRDNTSGVFTLFNLGSGDWENKMCMKTCKIYVNGVLVRDFIPAMRNSDGSTGLYDKVNKVFYENKGTGSFGSDVLDLSAYTQVEYIQSTGTQYIDTGFYAKPTTSVEIDFQFTDLTVQQRLFGYTIKTNSSTDLGFSHGVYINGNGYYAYSYTDGGGNWISTETKPTTDRTKLVMDGKARTLTISGGSTYSGSLKGSPTKDAQLSMYIMADHRADSSGWNGKFKLYHFKVWDNGAIARNFIPVMRSSDSVYGLYDTVNKVFYTNAGTGSFTGA